MVKGLNSDFTLKNFLFGAVKITKTADPNKYFYSEYGIEFDSRPLFSIPNFDLDKNAIIFGVYMSSSMHIDNKYRDISIIGKGPTQGFDNTTLLAEAEYSINFSKKILLKSSL